MDTATNVRVPADLLEKDLREAHLRGLERIAQLRKAAEPVLETGEVCELLGVSRETIRKEMDRKQLLALLKGGDRVFPAFQFRKSEVLPGIAEVLSSLDTDSHLSPCPFCSARTPSGAANPLANCCGRETWNPW
jgi:hypothetical protein